MLLLFVEANDEILARLLVTFAALDMDSIVVLSLVFVFDETLTVVVVVVAEWPQHFSNHFAMLK